MSYVTCHLSPDRYSLQLQVLGRCTKIWWYIMQMQKNHKHLVFPCHVSCVVCNFSCVTYHLSPDQWPPLYVVSALMKVSGDLVMRRRRPGNRYSIKPFFDAKNSKHICNLRKTLLGMSPLVSTRGGGGSHTRLFIETIDVTIIDTIKDTNKRRIDQMYNFIYDPSCQR